MSSSAIPEKINALANNQRLLATRHGLSVAIVASLNGGLVISADQAAVLNNAMAVAQYNYCHSDPSRIAVSGSELVVRTLGISLKL